MCRKVAGGCIGIPSFLVALVALGCNREKSKPPTPPPPQVTVAHPVMFPVQSYYEYNGNLEAVESVEIRARVKGILEEIHFVEGDEVEAGAPLYTIDPREYRAAVARATADEAKAAADILNWQAQIRLAGDGATAAASFSRRRGHAIRNRQSSLNR